MNITTEERERYQRYLCSREWAVLKEAVRRRCGGVCERCNHFPMDHTHHLTYARKYNERLEDLAGWCVGCHEFTHGKRDRDPRLDVPVFVNGDIVTSVYLAGRFNRWNDWRAKIVPGWKIGSPRYALSAVLPDGRELILKGPWWNDMSHNGDSGVGPHACADYTWGDHGFIGSIDDPDHVLEERLGEIDNSSLMFAWLDSRECLGTVAEIGYCHREGPYLVVAVPEWDRELWFACKMANRFIIAPTAIDAWRKLWSGEHDSLGEIADWATGSEPDEQEPCSWESGPEFSKNDY